MEYSSIFSLPWLVLIYILFSFYVATATRFNNFPSQSSLRLLQDCEIVPKPYLKEDFKTGSYSAFKQKYIINSKHWGGAKANAPIFVSFGAESPLQEAGSDFISDLASRFKAIMLYMEVCHKLLMLHLKY
ncbi:hypothetical protein Pint_27647 [Pistacia integerrima]|uniref:Uncharacterized protein n=1 Tax=Pistacia integerrima TaxID=434235 RepID=A0ACC0YQG0_9ROSI|nr:hypothetical protein Pint_27647 [Pistacia integerrima]